MTDVIQIAKDTLKRSEKVTYQDDDVYIFCSAAIVLASAVIEQAGEIDSLHKKIDLANNYVNDWSDAAKRMLTALEKISNLDKTTNDPVEAANEALWTARAAIGYSARGE